MSKGKPLTITLLLLPKQGEAAAKPVLQYWDDGLEEHKLESESVWGPARRIIAERVCKEAGERFSRMKPDDR